MALCSAAVVVVDPVLPPSSTSTDSDSESETIVIIDPATSTAPIPAAPPSVMPPNSSISSGTGVTSTSGGPTTETALAAQILLKAQLDLYLGNMESTRPTTTPGPASVAPIPSTVASLPSGPPPTTGPIPLPTTTTTTTTMNGGNALTQNKSASLATALLDHFQMLQQQQTSPQQLHQSFNDFLSAAVASILATNPAHRPPSLVPTPTLSNAKQSIPSTLPSPVPLVIVTSPPRSSSSSSQPSPVPIPTSTTTTAPQLPIVYPWTHYNQQNQQAPPSPPHDRAQYIRPSKRRNSVPAGRIFSCTFPNCDKMFMQFAHLKIHQRKHTGERPYVCHYPGCDKSFTQLGNLKTHERKHTGEKPFKCSHEGCTKAFSQMGNMKTHELLHLGVKPFVCDNEGCERAFSQLGNLRSHQAKVHAEPSRKRSHSPAASEDDSVFKRQRRRYKRGDHLVPVKMELTTPPPSASDPHSDSDSDSDFLHRVSDDDEEEEEEEEEEIKEEILLANMKAVLQRRASGPEALRLALPVIDE